MKCPHCEHELVTKTFRDTSTFICRSCHGLWLPGDSLKTLLRSSVVAQLGNIEGQRKVALKCPNDETPLDEAKRFGVVLDRCTACLGIWLDEGEINSLLMKSRAPKEHPSSDEPTQKNYWKAYRSSLQNNDDKWFDLALDVLFGFFTGI